MTEMSRPIVLGAGGTGGHVFPAQALAMELLDRGYRLVLVADSRSEAFDGALGELDVHRIDAAGTAGRGYGAKLIALFRLGRGYLQARRLLRRLDPLVVVGFGSYSRHQLFCAQHIGCRTVIHEQNAAGRANRMLAPRASDRDGVQSPGRYAADREKRQDR